MNNCYNCNKPQRNWRHRFCRDCHKLKKCSDCNHKVTNGALKCDICLSPKVKCKFCSEDFHQINGLTDKCDKCKNKFLIKCHGCNSSYVSSSSYITSYYGGCQTCLKEKDFIFTFGSVDNEDYVVRGKYEICEKRYGYSSGSTETTTKVLTLPLSKMVKNVDLNILNEIIGDALYFYDYHMINNCGDETQYTLVGDATVIKIDPIDLGR